MTGFFRETINAFSDAQCSMLQRLTFIFLVFALGLLPAAAQAILEETYNYDDASEQLIWRGVKTLMMCNGVFVSNRTPDQVMADEWAYTRGRPGSYDNDGYGIDMTARMVTMGGRFGVPAMKAVHREGYGCIIMEPGQPDEAAADFPILDLQSPPGDPANIPWPDGDLTGEPDWTGIDQAALKAASDWAFDRPVDRQKTLSLVVVHRGEIILERYADGFDMTTRTRTWSTAKSIFSALVGIMVDDGRLALDESLGLDWLPEAQGDAPDPRNTITLRHVLHMSSGLYPVDNRVEYATGSGRAYWAGASSARGAVNRGLIRQPGTHWDYENYDTLLGVLAMKRALGGGSAYAEFPRRALFDRIGMRNTVVGVDRFGDFIFSSQIYTNARDLARFGLLHLNDGMWGDERILSKDWIDFIRTPAPATGSRGAFYGGQWWLVPAGRDDVPADAYTTNGNRGQFTIVVPSADLVIVRRGLDFGRQGFSPWDLTHEVMKAFQ